MDSSRKADGIYDPRFLLCDRESGGSQVGETFMLENMEVADDLLSVCLDSGPEAFRGEARWLQIAIRQGDDTDPFANFDANRNRDDSTRRREVATAFSIQRILAVSRLRLFGIIGGN